VQATAKDLRFHTRELMNSVARGEEVIITFHGKPRAKLVPCMDPKEREDTELFGMWKDNDIAADVNAYVRDLRTGRF